MPKQIDNLEFFQVVNFEFINSLRNSGTKYLLIFADSYAEICKSKEFVDIATAARRWGICTKYLKHNLFHQSQLRRDVELHNIHMVLFKSPQDVHQFALLSVQLGLASAFVDWYRDGTFVLFCHLLIDLFPPTDDRLRYCKNSENFACKIQFLRTCPKQFIRFLSVCIVHLLQGNLSKAKRSHVLNYGDEVHELSWKRTTWKQRRSLLSSRDGLLLIKSISAFFVNHLS